MVVTSTLRRDYELKKGLSPARVRRYGLVKLPARVSRYDYNRPSAGVGNQLYPNFNKIR